MNGWLVTAALVGMLAGCAHAETGIEGANRPAVQAWSDDALDRVLSRFVDDAGRVDYPALARDRADLDAYVAKLARVSPDNRPDLFPTDAHRLAYWMNAYNALMLHRVVEAWPIKSVRDIRAAYGVFWMEKHTLGGEGWTLRGLENKVIRERFGDPRIHFAIVCASVGCPPLPRHAWHAETLDADLDRAARRFIANPRNVRLDRQAGVAYLSSIFDWYQDDFTDWMERQGIPHPHGVLDYVTRYLPEDRAGSWNPDRLRTEWVEYDWSVNARRPAN